MRGGGGGGRRRAAFGGVAMTNAVEVHHAIATSREGLSASRSPQAQSLLVSASAGDSKMTAPAPSQLGSYPKFVLLDVMVGASDPPRLPRSPGPTARYERNHRGPFPDQDTIVKDPFYTHMADFFGLSFEELLKAKHPTAWLSFEQGQITDREFYDSFMRDGSPIDSDGLVSTMEEAYEFIPGMEELLSDLAASPCDVHAMSNYPMWYRRIESKLQLSKYLSWTFMSCDGPMKGLRKPSPEAFQVVIEHLAVAQPQEVLFVDDREANVAAAAAMGMDAIHFCSPADLRQQLRQRGVL